MAGNYAKDASSMSILLQIIGSVHTNALALSSPRLMVSELDAKARSGMTRRELLPAEQQGGGARDDG